VTQGVLPQQNHHKTLLLSPQNTSLATLHKRTPEAKHTMSASEMEVHNSCLQK
jgi:hypothetical protein